MKNKILKLLETIKVEKLQYFFRRHENKELLNELILATEFLGKASFGERLYCVLNDIKATKHCNNPKCNNPVVFQWLSAGYAKYCSYKCSATSQETINIRSTTTLERYGVSNVSKCKNIKQKKIDTVRSNFNVDHPTQSHKVIEKRQKNNLIKFGHKSCPKEQLLKTALKYNLQNNNNEQIINYDFEKGCYSVFCQKCDEISIYTNQCSIWNRLFLQKSNICLNCHPFNNNVSNIEIQMASFIKDIYNGEIILNDRTVLKGKEIDILLSELNIGVEINGLYWHSDTFHSKTQDHDKMVKCKEKGLQLYQFFEDELPQAMMLIYSIIANKGALKPDIDINELNEKYGLSIKSFEKSKFYARECKLVKIIDKDKAKEMLELYHIQGSDKAKYYYGLIDKDGSLLSVMTFKKMSVDKNQKKSNNEDTYELSRYVTLPGIQIIGGFQKLLKSFIKDIPNAKILTYSNLRYSNEDDNVYMRNGFINNGFTGVNYYYYFKGRRFHRFNFRKDNLYNNILPKYGVDVSEDYKSESESGMVQKLIDNGHDVHKVYDCGNIKWIYNS